jgi:ketoreductase
MRLLERVALITGASKGIGLAIALAYANEGADIATCARSERNLEEAAEAIRQTGRRCWYKSADVTDKAQAVATVEGALAEFGKIDILVNNAGGGDRADTRTLLEMDDKCWFDNLDLHLNSVWYFTKAVLPYMVERRYGRVINIASIGGLQGMPRLGAYTVAKHGVIGLTRTLALEAGKYGITCNAICPGATRSGWTISKTGLGKLAEEAGMDIEDYTVRSLSGSALRRIIEPEEIAQLAVYLASDAAAAMTGQSISICGGLNMH